jgi:hypothetical protein
MIRRLRVDWPDPRPFESRDGRPIRWLAVSDDEERALEYAANREALGMLDAIVGAGDLQPDYLGFLADAFHTRLAYVRGNHDQGGRWEGSVEVQASDAWSSGSIHELDGLPILTLEWPGIRFHDRRRHDQSATFDVARLLSRLALRRLTGRAGPTIVLSHAPPRGVGDCDGADDPFHAGFGAYRWLLDRVEPPLWLHGHTHPAATANEWRIAYGSSQVVNVTGAVLVEIRPPTVDAEGSREVA